MKTRIKPIFILIAVLFAIHGGVAGKTTEFTREIKKDFAVNPGAKLILDNKFGDIRITATDQNKVSVQVLITVDARDLESATKFFEKVNIQFTNTADQVEARTILDEDMRTRGSFSIDYHITMPVSMSLDATNKFGDLIAGEIAGKARLKVGYGNLEVGKLSNSDNLVEVRFGEADFNSVKGAVVTIKYSDMDIEYAGSLNLNSEFSDVTVETGVVMDATFEGGNLEIGTLSVLTCRSKFSDIVIEGLDQKLDLTNKYGSFEIESIPSKFSSLSVVNDYGNIELGISADASYKLDATMHFCNLEFNKGKASFDYLNDSDHDLTARGTVGTNPTATVKVISNFGNVELE